MRGSPFTRPVPEIRQVPPRGAPPFQACRTHERVASYVEIIEGRRVAGPRVAIIGAGGIGFDVAEFLTHTGNVDGHASDPEVEKALAKLKNRAQLFRVLGSYPKALL